MRVCRWRGAGSAARWQQAPKAKGDIVAAPSHDSCTTMRSAASHTAALVRAHKGQQTCWHNSRTAAARQRPPASRRTCASLSSRSFLAALSSGRYFISSLNRLSAMFLSSVRVKRLRAGGTCGQGGREGLQEGRHSKDIGVKRQ